MVNEEVTRQVIAIAKKGNITSAKAILKLMQMLMKEAAKKGKTRDQHRRRRRRARRHGRPRRSNVARHRDRGVSHRAATPGR